MESCHTHPEPHLANRGALGVLLCDGCREAHVDEAPEDRVQAQFEHVQKTDLQQGPVEGSVVYSTYLSVLPCPGRQGGPERLDIITVLRHGSMYQVYSWATLTRSAGRPWNHNQQHHHAS